MTHQLILAWGQPSFSCSSFKGMTGAKKSGIGQFTYWLTTGRKREERKKDERAMRRKQQEECRFLEILQLQSPVQFRTAHSGQSGWTLNIGGGKKRAKHYVDMVGGRKKHKLFFFLSLSGPWRPETTSSISNNNKKNGNGHSELSVREKKSTGGDENLRSNYSNNLERNLLNQIVRRHAASRVWVGRWLPADCWPSSHPRDPFSSWLPSPSPPQNNGNV